MWLNGKALFEYFLVSLTDRGNSRRVPLSLFRCDKFNYLLVRNSFDCIPDGRLIFFLRLRREGKERIRSTRKNVARASVGIAKTLTLGGGANGHN